MKILHYLLLMGCLLGANTLKAQISYGGTPTSFGSTFKNSALSEVTLNSFLIPTLDMARVRAEDAKGGNRFAAATLVDITPENAGLWQNLPTGDRLWRVSLKVQTAEVTGMRLLFDKFNLPMGGKLFIYTADHEMVLGSFTSENNHASGVFATTLLRGREVIMEYYEPASAKGKIVLSLNRIDQAYKNPYLEKKSVKRGGSPTDFGEADVCTINVNCSPIMNDWQDEKRGVVRILVVDPTGSGYCSGSLINNTAMNNKPYLLTANHCAEGVTTANLNQWVFDFNYEIATANCSNPTNPTAQSMTGASLVSSEESSDFYLLELNQAVPLSYNAYFNGWDKTATLPNGGMSIHHPSGDVKKFCNDIDPLTSVTINGVPSANGKFLNASWNNGITEGGSSGSPLFSNAGHIVGQLLGGSSFCNAPTAPDWYGKVSVSWTGDGSPATRLSDWLDPSNSGVTTLNGQNVGTLVVVKFTASANTTYLPASVTFTNTSTGATTWSWNFGVGASPATATTAGPHTVTYSTIGAKTVTLTINGLPNNVATKTISILPTLSLDYLPTDGGNFEANNGHFMGVNVAGINFERGNSTVAGKNGTAGGANAYVTGLTAAQYPDNSECHLYTPNYNFSATGTYTVQFKTKFKTEATFDGFIVEYTTNKGTSWTKLGSAVATGWYNSTASANINPLVFPVGAAMFSGTASTFETKTFNASALAGNANVAFRFVFKSDEGFADAGVAIDDFQVTGPFAATTFLPANSATNVVTNADLLVTFTRPVLKGTGNIVIKKASDNSVIENIAVTAANVTVAGNVATINPTADLAQGTQVYVEIASGAFKDANNVVYAGITGSTTWKFTTTSDLVAPTLVSLSPANNATVVAVDANLVITLNENVKKGTMGNITIKKLSDNSVIEDIPVTNANVTIANAVVTINPTNNLPIVTDVYVEVSNGAIQDIAGNNYAGITGNSTWKFTTDTETVPPTALSFNPAHNSINVSLNTDLVITFSENVKKGAGNIVIRKTSDNTAVETIAVSNAQVSIAGAVVTINPTTDFVANTGHYIEISAGAIQDIAGNNFAGFTVLSTWAFTTLDNILPTLVSVSPVDEATNVIPTTNLVMTFSENVKKGTTGSVTIKKVSDNSIVETLAITSTNITIANAVVTINPNDFGSLTAYYVEVSAGAIQDIAGNNYAGISGNTTWNFTSAVETIAPTVLTFSPVHNNTSFPGANNLTITFSEAVKKGTAGNIVLKKFSDNTVVETFIVASSGLVTVAGTVVTINPTNDLLFNTDYYVEINAGAIQDIAGNNFAGFSGANTWKFKTDFSTAIEDTQLANALTIYPNPTAKWATLQVRQGTPLQEATLRLLDMAGKTVWQTQAKLLAESQTFDWDNLPAGKYLLEVKTKQGTAFKVVVKQ